jgi:hypothetical protein
MRLNFLVNEGTGWLYPMADIQRALKVTLQPYTFDGTNIVCPTMTALKALYYDIFYTTTLSQPIGNLGFSLGKGTFLEDLGKTITFQLQGGRVVVIWRLVRQVTPQNIQSIPDPGNSLDNTIGYITTFVSYGNGPDGGYYNDLDDVVVVRVG